MHQNHVPTTLVLDRHPRALPPPPGRQIGTPPASRHEWMRTRSMGAGRRATRSTAPSRRGRAIAARGHVRWSRRPRRAGVAPLRQTRPQRRTLASRAWAVLAAQAQLRGARLVRESWSHLFIVRNSTTCPPARLTRRGRPVRPLGVACWIVMILRGSCRNALMTRPSERSANRPHCSLPLLKHRRRT